MLLHEFDPCETAIFNPSMVFSPIEGMPKVAVSCFSRVTFERMLAMFPDAEQIAVMKCASQVFPVYRAEVKGTPIALYMSGVGAPQCVGSLEEIFAMGVRCVVLFGTCGVLDRNIEDCGIILPTSALRDEGTSYHYAPPGDEIKVNLRYREVFTGLLEEMHIRYTQGKCWTTDSMFRETREKVNRRREQGCVCVDMECASCAAAAQFRGKDVLQFFYAADNLDSDVWDERSLSNNARMEDKDRIALLAAETAVRITHAMNDK
ncbi:MAG: nucleoside phosphorylase [Clostridia bacterium]|nr:nucleoside phosphorylase [Clostridia bacterium]